MQCPSAASSLMISREVGHKDAAVENARSIDGGCYSRHGGVGVVRGSLLGQRCGVVHRTRRLTSARRTVGRVGAAHRAEAHAPLFVPVRVGRVSRTSTRSAAPSSVPTNHGLEPSRQTVPCNHVATARGSARGVRPPWNIRTKMNTERFLADHRAYFSGAYEQFCAFGGPCVYFHRECLRARDTEFLSHRHIEMLYATLTAWGMHRMGDTDTTKTKLTEWDQFRESLSATAAPLVAFQGMKLLDSSEREYSDAVSNLWPCYRAMRLSVSGATIVVNSKAFYHLLPDFIPPIDRQYTVRFFGQPPDKWRDRKGKFKTVTLPPDLDAQFRLFHSICVKVKRLADRIDGALFETELRAHGVTPPKAIDNAIVNYVRVISASRIVEV